MNNLLASVKINPVAYLFFIVLGIAGIVLAVNSGNTAFYVLGVLGILFGAYVAYTTISKNRSYKYIHDNYKTDPIKCLDIIDKDIARMKSSIAIDQRKADRGGRDSKDSANDVIRKQKRLDMFLEVKEEIEKYA